MPVDFSVTNQLASPAIYASSFATRPAASFKGRLFVDTNNPSTGIYRDTGTAWTAIAGTGVAETQNLNSVCTIGNSTASLGILLYGDTAIGSYVFDGDTIQYPAAEGYALSVGDSGAGGGKSILTNLDCNINGLNIGRGANNIASNTSLGKNVLDGNDTGEFNTGGGYQSLFLNLEGSGNTAYGYQSAKNNTEGVDNTAVGKNALLNNSSGGNNVAIGVEALDALTEGNNNIGIGHNAGNVVDGARNIFIGTNTGLVRTYDNNSVVIGYGAMATDSNQFVIGTASNNVGSVDTEVNASSRVWNVVINGVARKILLA